MRNRFVLLVEDDPAARDLILDSWRKAKLGPEVVVEDDGEAMEFLRCAGRYAGRDASQVPAFVLLDLRGAEDGGIAMLGEMRADPRTALIPVVLLCSSAEAEQIRKNYEAGANSCVLKPSEAPEFASAVTRIGEYWLLINQTASGS